MTLDVVRPSIDAICTYISRSAMRRPLVPEGVLLVAQVDVNLLDAG
jgi:hypothetical protein